MFGAELSIRRQFPAADGRIPLGAPELKPMHFTELMDEVK